MTKSGHQVRLEASRIDVDQEFGNANYLGSDDKILATIGYGYNFEFDKIFVRPSITYTIGSIDIKDTDGTDDESTFTPNFSIESDVGYNVTEKLGVFGTVGLGLSNLERNQPSTGFKADANSTGLILGFGAEYEVFENLRLNARYQISQFNYDVANTSSDYELDISTIKLGLSYSF